MENGIGVMKAFGKIKCSLLVINKIHLFDVYEGDKVSKDSKSLAARYIFSSEEKTLTEKEITCLAKWLEGEIGAQQR